MIEKEIGCLELQRIIGKAIVDQIKDVCGDGDDLSAIDAADVLAMATSAVARVIGMERARVVVKHSCGATGVTIHHAWGTLSEWAQSIGWPER